jgi:hypothetical protein
VSKPARKKIQSPFAKNLKAILHERGLAQRAASEIAGVSPAVPNDCLAGSTPSDHLAVQRLAKGLGCSFEWLLTGVEGRLDPKSISMSELFEIEDDATFSGIFQVSAKRLRRKV